MKRILKCNPRFAIAFVLLFAIETVIALYVHDQIIRPFVGDILVVILLYCFVRSFLRPRVMLLPVYIFLFAAAVEFGQLIGLVELLHLQDSAVAHTILGTTFDIKDIFCYFIGCVLLLAGQWAAPRWKRQL